MIDDTYHFNDIASVVRSRPSIEQGRDALYELVLQHHPRSNRPLWRLLDSLDWDADVARVSDALAERFQVDVTPDVTGIYLGIDGINMPGGKGIEFGCSTAWSPAARDLDYVYHCERYLDDLPMPTLAAYYDWYYNAPDSSVRHPECLFVEFPVCLGMSALVVCHALARLDPSLVCGASKSTRCIAYGFHDGDMMRLGRATPEGFVNEATFDCW